MKLIILIIFIIWGNFSLASFPEFFGSGSQSAGIGNQFTGDADDASNNYYVPAYLAYSESVGISYSMHAVQTDFYDMDNILLKNDTTASNDLRGDIKSDNYGASFINVFHFNLPIKRKNGLKIGLSIYTPMKYFQETNSGRIFAPEYVMYRSRYHRTQLFFNLAYPFTKHWAASVGIHSGMQVNAKSDSTLRFNDTDGSFTSAQTKAKPTISPLFSIIYKFNKHAQAYLGYQHEMKSKIRMTASGHSDPVNLPMELQIDSMANYDPSIVRLGFASKVISQYSKIFGSLEYQFWDNYEPPYFTMKKVGGLASGQTIFESVKTRNIIVPKIGVAINFTDAITFRLGSFYRPTPLQGNFTGIGNSIDTDMLGLTTGLGSKFKVFDIPMEFNTSFQYIVLKDKHVTKNSNLENGNSGDKIGSPGYTIGGEVYTFSVGLNLLM